MIRAGHKHRAAVPVVEHGWTTWPRHRDLDAEPIAADGMEEYLRKVVAAMKVRQAELRRARAAAWS